MFLSCHVRVSEWIYTLYLSEWQELLAQNRREIRSISDCNWTRPHNHLVQKRTLNHLAKLAKWLNWIVSTYLYGACDCIFLSCHIRTCFEQRAPWHSGNYRVWIHSETSSQFNSGPPVQSSPPYRYVFKNQFNHLVSLAKWLSVRLQTKWLWVRVQLQWLTPISLSKKVGPLWKVFLENSAPIL